MAGKGDYMDEEVKRLLEKMDPSPEVKKFTLADFEQSCEEMEELVKMRNDFLQEHYKAEQARLEKIEKEIRENPLSQYSITELKAEIRRRKGKNGRKQVIKY